MDLYILRHGIAEEVSNSGQDRDRVLTDAGIEKTIAAGKALRKLGMEFDVILSSPYARAWRTAEIVAEELDCKEKLQAAEVLSAGAGPANVLAELKRTKHASVLVVGHEPDLSRLISVLLSGSPSLSITMKKGGFCKLTCVRPEPGAACLEWLLSPKHSSRMA